MQKGHPLHINIPITKIDEEQRMVWGYATVEEVDAHGEIIGYQASKKAFPNWLGNIREMHGPTAIGKSIEIRFDDDNKGVWLGSYISESADGENAWIKVKEGILQAYSIGGTVKNFEMVKVGDDSHLMVTDYDLFEVSLVDNPACPSAMLQVVKSVNGQLTQTEKMAKGLGRPVAWWETMYQFSSSQNIIKGGVMLYNNNSMTKKTTELAKDIYSADQLVDLGACLADFIWFSRWEGKDTSDLEAALTSIKQAASTELGQDENFPDNVMSDIEMACQALNITKVEELTKMVNEKLELKKAGIAPVDGDPRDANAATVSEVTATTPIKPAATKVPKKVYGADGKSTASKVNVDSGEERDTDGNVTETVEESTPVPTPAAPVVTVNKPGDVVETPEEPATPETPETPAEGDATTEPTTPVENAASAGDLTKVTEQSDLTKSILEGVGALIEKAVKPLKEEIDQLKTQPAASKRGASFMDVEKVAPGTGNTEMDNNKTRFDELMAKAEDFAAHPEKGSIQDRVKIGVELRKLSRLMDPASRAQHAAIRASFQNGG